MRTSTSCSKVSEIRAEHGKRVAELKKPKKFVEENDVETVKLLLIGKEVDIRNTAITSVKIKINGVDKW